MVLRPPRSPLFPYTTLFRSIPIAGKPFVTVVAGGMELDPAVEQLHRILGWFQVNVIDTVKFESKVPPCLKCGRHKECEIGGLYMMQGEAAKELVITKEMFSRVGEKYCDCCSGRYCSRRTEEVEVKKPPK